MNRIQKLKQYLEEGASIYFSLTGVTFGGRQDNLKTAMANGCPMPVCLKKGQLEKYPYALEVLTEEGISLGWIPEKEHEYKVKCKNGKITSMVFEMFNKVLIDEFNLSTLKLVLVAVRGGNEYNMSGRMKLTLIV